ncbi:MAG: hypothetical protein WB764_10620 [Xanthobacteraceae bacterium]
MAPGHISASDTEELPQRLAVRLAECIAAAARVRCLKLVVQLRRPLVMPWIAFEEQTFLDAVADSDCSETVEAEILAIVDRARYRASTAWPEPGVGLTYVRRVRGGYWPEARPIEDFIRYAEIQGYA